MTVRCVVGSQARDLTDADKIILPGVGHFGSAMSHLSASGLRDVLDEIVLAKQKPVLGICLGMELMAKRSEEGDSEGLGWLDAEAVRFRVSDKNRYKVPHMGWNTAPANRESILLKGIGRDAEFYFAHSYYLDVADRDCVVSETDYESRFVSMIERENLFGVQYHPEKSHEAGDLVLKNFVEI